MFVCSSFCKMVKHTTYGKEGKKHVEKEGSVHLEPDPSDQELFTSLPNQRLLKYPSSRSNIVETLFPDHELLTCVPLLPTPKTVDLHPLQEERHGRYCLLMSMGGCLAGPDQWSPCPPRSAIAEVKICNICVKSQNVK